MLQLPDHPVVNSDSSQPTVELHGLPCLARIRGLYSQLTRAEQRVADFVLAYSSRVRTMSITDVAHQSDVGLGTVNRFCTRLGYKGHPDFKLALAVELLTPDQYIAEPLRAEDTPATVLQKTLKYGVQSLNDTAQLLDVSAFATAAERLAKASRIEFYAVGGLSGPIAMLAAYRFMTLGIASAAFTEPLQQAIAAGLLPLASVAVLMSNSGTNTHSLEALAAAQQSGALTIAITSAPESPLGKHADLLLQTASQETVMWSDTVTSRSPMLGVVDGLYAAVALFKHREQS